MKYKYQYKYSNALSWGRRELGVLWDLWAPCLFHIQQVYFNRGAKGATEKNVTHNDNTSNYIATTHAVHDFDQSKLLPIAALRFLEKIKSLTFGLILTLRMLFHTKALVISIATLWWASSGPGARTTGHPAQGCDYCNYKSAHISQTTLPQVSSTQWQMIMTLLTGTVKPVCNDHLYNKIYYLCLIQWYVLMKTEGTNLLVLTISAFWSSSRWPLAT